MAHLSINPLCACCAIEGRVVAADAVDHVFPWKNYGAHAFRRNIFQSLCFEDHSRKTALEAKGIYRHYAPDGMKDYGYEDYAYVVRNL